MCFKSIFFFVLFTGACGLLIGIFCLSCSPFSLQPAEIPSGFSIKDNQTPYPIKPEIRQKQIDLITHFITILQPTDIRYWITESTLLACILFRSFLPWQDTIHFAMMKQDLPKLLQLRPQLEKQGSFLGKLIHHKHGYKFCFDNLVQYPCIDIRIMAECNGEIALCTPTNELAECTFDDSLYRRREVFPTLSIFPLSETAFCNTKVKICAQAEKCLQILYGPFWNSQLEVDAFAPIRNRCTLSIWEHVQWKLGYL
jgi:hypothetical protein